LLWLAWCKRRWVNLLSLIFLKRKTTTFKMLCGEIPPSTGDAYICENNIKT